MGVYLKIIAKQIKLRWVYRSNIYLSIVGNIFYYFLMISVWQALYQNNDLVNGVNLSQMITYTLVSSLVSSFSRSMIAYTMANQVKDGTIGNEMVKPLSYKWMHVSQEIGSNVFFTLVITLPAMILMFILYGVKLPSSMMDLTLFFVSAVLGIMMAWTINFIFGMLAFWLKTPEYVAFLTSALRTLFAGGVVPLWFYPEWLRTIAKALPFRFMTFEPLAIYLGQYTWSESLQVLLIQVVWCLVLYGIEKIMWRGIQRYLVIQGG